MRGLMIVETLVTPRKKAFWRLHAPTKVTNVGGWTR